MIGKHLKPSKGGSTLEYDLGATKKKDQKIRIAYYEGLILKPELVFELNNNWETDQEKRQFKKAARKLKKQLAKQYKDVASINDRVKYEVGHIALSYSPEDRKKLEDNPGLRVEIAREYLERMGIVNTPFIIVSHYGTNAPHDHIAYSRVRFDGTCISGKYSRIRSVVISRELTKKYGLCQGGETPKAEKSPADFWAPLRIQVREAVAKCADFCELSNVLNDMGIELRIVERGKRKGLSFRKGKHKIPGYKLDRGLTYAKISEKLTINKSARLAEEQAKRSAIEREKERQKTVMKALNMESIKQYLLNSDLQEFLDKIMSFYDFPAWHYHLVPYEMVEHNDGIRLVLYTDGLMRDIERGIERNTDSLPQDTGESYIDFYCNEDGDIKAQVEFDPMNSHTAGLSGTINPSGGDIMITVRDYVGTKESHEQKMRQTPSTGTQIEEEVVWESQNDRSRIVDKAGEFILQKGVQGNVVGGKPSWEWEDEDYFKEFDVLKSDDTYDYLIIKKHDGEIKYINQLGYSLNTKQLSQLGVTSGKGMGGPS